jgi:hypothetical protein
MSHTTADNHCKPRLTAALAGLTSAAVLLLTPATAPAAAPIRSSRPGLEAQATCSDGSEPAPTEGWAHGTIGGYPTISGALDTCSAAGGSLSLRAEGTV